MESLVIIGRLSLTFLLALMFGFERQKSHKPVGLGAFIFVSVGSCGLAMAALVLSPDAPLPLLSGIVTGIGFLGAGALIKTSDKIFGVNTAAGIWSYAIFGLLMGVGQYLMAMSIYVLIWAVILIDWRLEIKGIGTYQRKLVITTNTIVPEHEIKNILLTQLHKYKLIEVAFDKTNKKMTLTYLIECTKDKMNKLPTILYKMEWLSECRIE